MVSGAEGVVRRQGFDGKHVDRRPKAPGEHQLGQCIEVDEVGAADHAEDLLRAEQLHQ